MTCVRRINRLYKFLHTDASAKHVSIILHIAAVFKQLQIHSWRCIKQSVVAKEFATTVIL